MAKFLIILLRMAVPAVLVLGAATGPGRAQERDNIRVVGSSTMYRMSATVAETYGRTRGMAAPVVESTGSGGGFKRFCAGVGAATPDVVAASRMMTESEARACQANHVDKVVELPVGFGGVVVVSGPEAPDLTLTRRHVWLAIAAEVPVGDRMVPNPYKRWRDIDPALPDLPIQIYGPPPTSGTRDVLVGMIVEPPCREHPVVAAVAEEARHRLCQRLREDGAFIQAGELDDNLARRVLANPHALGIVGFHVLEENLGLKAATIDGVPPTFASILEGRYPLIRPLYIYVKGDHVGRVPGLADFAATYVSDTAIGPEGYLTDIGLVPLPAGERQVTQQRAAGLTKH
jgi:phosphate transport system substrate-binding protein